ncbi:hypothetical protein HYX16_06510 [Candidatus Woesearchaeota archaeon]|nr:hypothetical protein [Candidatus Woesearchaeota archaeon]
MEKQDVIIKADMGELGTISSIIQEKGDFQSIEQEGECLIIIARIPMDEFDSIKEKLNEALLNDFSIDLKKKI